MKLGKAIGWGIPFLTTWSGKRGYKLTDADFLTTPDNVQEFVSRLLELISDNQKILKARETVENIKINSPSIHKLADIVSTFLRV